MDIPLPKRRITWRDSPWWRATVLSLASGAAIAAVAYPLISWGTAELIQLARLQTDRLPIASELAKGTLLMLPYLWAYFFALENIARKRHDNLLPSLPER